MVPEGEPSVVFASGPIAFSGHVQAGELGEILASPGPSGASLAHGDESDDTERFDAAEFVSDSDPSLSSSTGVRLADM